MPSRRPTPALGERYLPWGPDVYSESCEYEHFQFSIQDRCAFIHSFSVHDLNPRRVLGLTLGAGDIVENETKCYPQFADILVGQGRQNTNMQIII